MVRAFLAGLLLASGLTAPETPAENSSIPTDGEAIFTGAPAIYLTGRINGHPVTMLLDSGATRTVVDTKFADSIGLKPSGTVRLHATNGTAKGGMASGVTISIGKFVLTGQKIVIADLSVVQTQPPLDMILGQNAFDAAVIDIDLATHELVFHDLSTYRPPRDAIPLKMKRSRGLIFVPVSIEGKPVDAEFDLGQNVPLAVSRAYSAKANLLDGRRMSTTQVSGTGGTSAWDAMRVKSLSVAGIEFHDVPASIPPRDDALPGKSAVVGLPVWSRFHMEIDFHRGNLWLLPEPDAGTKAFARDRTGLGVIRDGDHFLISHVAANSPAEAAHWKAGDVIVAINGHRTDASFDNGADSGWAIAAPGTPVNFTMADGSVRTLILADYY